VVLGNLRKVKEDRGEEQSKEKDGGSASVGDGPGRTRRKEKSTFFCCRGFFAAKLG
jgi:hypothetical protein